MVARRLPAAAGVRAGQRPPDESRSAGLHVQTLLDAFERWRGAFTDFCQHARHHLRVPFGRARIATILDTCGLRPLERRPGRSPDEAALPRAFQTFFPSAQWVGDGLQLPVNLLAHYALNAAAAAGTRLVTAEHVQAALPETN